MIHFKNIKNLSVIDPSESGNSFNCLVPSCYFLCHCLHIDFFGSVATVLMNNEMSSLK